MNFNSLEFAIFLPIVFTIYWMLPHKLRWIVLLISSYYFYMSWNPQYVVLIFFTTCVSYFAAILIEINENNIIKKMIMTVALLLCLGVLFLFKYYNFILDSIVAVARNFTISMNPITFDLLLPVGISFYTFQTLSYVIDVYRGNVHAERHLGIYATFISFFPQLVAGPIERTSNLLPQINSKKCFNYDLAIYGARQILWGLFKKIAVADMVAMYVDNAYNNLARCTGFDLCVAIFFFTIQIYCDFSGYSDIAIGTSKLLGINLIKNFSSPYFSLSVREFWSRWHISLSTWFRDYLYIPMGGNRCSKLRNYRNLMVTFLVSGLWHGANWTFVIWGGLHGVAQIIEKVIGLDELKRSKFGKLVSWFMVFIFCNLAWVFFRADSFSDAIFVIYHAFSSLTTISSLVHTNIGLDIRTLIYILIMIMIVAVYDYISLKTDVIELLQNKKKCLRLIIEYLIGMCIVYALVNGTGSNQFVYFQF